MRSPGMVFALFLAFSILSLALAEPANADSPNDGSTSPDTESLFLPLIYGPTPAKVLIVAAHIDSAVSYEPDEAISIRNVGGSEQALAGWQIAANTQSATFPITSTQTLRPGQQLWCAAQADAFHNAFGFSPACEWAEETNFDVPNLAGKLTISNRGGHLRLLDSTGRTVDALVYGDEKRPIDGWHGVAAQLYDRGAIGKTGQIWHRKLDPTSRAPVDADAASDWAGDLADLRWGRRVRMAGWRSESEGVPLMTTADATTTLAVGPEGLYGPIAQTLASASLTIDLSLYTLEHPQLTQVLVDAVRRGVQLRLLLEGGPAGGISDLQRWCVNQIAGAGGQIRYLAPAPNAPSGYRTRYKFLHAKYAIVDGHSAFNGTENFTQDAMPVPGDEPVGGRRGFYLFTDAAQVVDELQNIFDHDWSPDRFFDLHPFEPDHRKYGGEPEDFAPPEPAVYEVEEARFDSIATTQTQSTVGVVSAPENALYPDGGLMDLIQRAGSGDEIVAWQLYEHRHWGDTASNPVADPNPRLEAVLDAARRGARVRLLLDSFFDDDGTLRNNRVTAEYLHDLARAEGLDIQARLGNPTGGGIHAKVTAVRLGEKRWSAIGSLNGGEISHKLNREVMLLTDAPTIHARLVEVFAWDWAHSE